MSTLASLGCGETAVITQITGGYSLKQKLASRGIKEGSRVQVISNLGGSIRGPIVVECNGNQMAIGREMAGRIKVKEG